MHLAAIPISTPYIFSHESQQEIFYFFSEKLDIQQKPEKLNAC